MFSRIVGSHAVKKRCSRTTAAVVFLLVFINVLAVGQIWWSASLNSRVGHSANVTQCLRALWKARVGPFFNISSICLVAEENAPSGLELQIDNRMVDVRTAIEDICDWTVILDDHYEPRSDFVWVLPYVRSELVWIAPHALRVHSLFQEIEANEAASFRWVNVRMVEECAALPTLFLFGKIIRDAHN